MSITIDGVTIQTEGSTPEEIAAAIREVEYQRPAREAARAAYIARELNISQEEAAAVIAEMPANGSPHPSKAGWVYDVNIPGYRPQSAPSELRTVDAIQAWLANTPGVAAANAEWGAAVNTDGRTETQAASQLAALNEILGSGPAALRAAAAVHNPNLTTTTPGGGGGLFSSTAGKQPSTLPTTTPKPSLTVAAVVAAALWLL